MFESVWLPIVAATATITSDFPMPRTLISDWKRVATSGKTSDGRTIDPQDLRDMAATYDPDNYTAVIWYEHIKPFGSFGTVAEAKCEELGGGKVRLFAKLKPNDRLLQLNKQEQKLFSSVEIQPNFADTGKAYLAGLAVTDNPASLGTEPLHFSRKAGNGNHFANVEELDDLTPSDFDEASAVSFFTRLFSRMGVIASTAPVEAPTLPPEETSMDPKIAESLAATAASFAASAASLQTSAATFSAQKPAPVAETIIEPVAVVVDPVAGNGITAAQFNELKGSLDSLTQNFNTALNQGKGQHVPDTTGAVTDEPEAVY